MFEKEELFELPKYDSSKIYTQILHEANYAAEKLSALAAYSPQELSIRFECMTYGYAFASNYLEALFTGQEAFYKRHSIIFEGLVLQSLNSLLVEGLKNYKSNESEFCKSRFDLYYSRVLREEEQGDGLLITSILSTILFKQPLKPIPEYLSDTSEQALERFLIMDLNFEQLLRIELNKFENHLRLKVEEFVGFVDL